MTLPVSLKPECQHFWLEMKSVQGAAGDGHGFVISLCKFCRRRGQFTMTEWGALAVEGKALNKPVRL